MLHSPGTHRPAAPEIPEDVQALATLMGVKFFWSGKEKKYYAVVAETPEAPEQLFSIDPYIATTDDEWLESMKFIADHIKSVKLGERKATELPPTGRKVFEDYIIARMQAEADATQPSQQEEKQHDTSPET